jgi:hypothetical protein
VPDVRPGRAATHPGRGSHTPYVQFDHATPTDAVVAEHVKRNRAGDRPAGRALMPPASRALPPERRSIESWR